ncbi:MAG TPA: regulatory iron-sulfur-containing complex subunit RicT [Chitinophagaceae bacterium]|nr:regulatory iron-sulfur-containing complex subunit RicT [Chitinophagaceae bacterium]
MGCEGCSSHSVGSNGKPAGCQSNGGCSSGGCNKFNVYNWLSDYPLSDFGTQYDIVEISFQNGNRKHFFRNTENLLLEKNQWVVVEGANGFDVGQVSVTGELVKLQMKKYGVKDNEDIQSILRIATEDDLEKYKIAKEKEKETLLNARVIARSMNLDMKVSLIEFQADCKKVTVFYTANERVDFRELIKVYAQEFRAKIEMRQIGARQESAKIGGIGSCGRELCCSSWLTDFKSVNTTAARYQNLSINQTKLSGQCGRLKCCLNYELDTYMEALKSFPQNAEIIFLKKGKATLQKKDIFRNLMWYSFDDSSKQYPLTIQRVHEILELNKKDIFPDEIEHIEIATTRKDPTKLVDVGFINDVGQISLENLGKAKGHKKSKKRRSNNLNVQQKSRTSNKKNTRKETIDTQRKHGNKKHTSAYSKNNRKDRQKSRNTKTANSKKQ